jgi:dCMP deaminase
MLVNARIKRFVSFGKYNDNAFMELFREADIEFEIKKHPSTEIKYLD